MENQVDLLEMVVTAIMGVPAELLEVYQADPGPWNQVGLMLLGVAALGWLVARVERRPRRRVR